MRDVEKQESTEMLIPPNGGIHYAEAELQLVEDDVELTMDTIREFLFVSEE